MRYSGLKQCVYDLDRTGQLIRIKAEIDPYLELAAVHRRVQSLHGPALLFENVKGSAFPVVSNLFGTLERARFIFRSTLKSVQKLVQLSAEPARIFKAPLYFSGALKAAANAMPKKVSSGPVETFTTHISKLPQVVCWPEDGGPFILLPQVYTEDPKSPGIFKSNLGMYRVQMAGNDYLEDREIGLHYQIRRDIGIHHTHAMELNQPLKVSIFVGGPPASTLAAVMPLPEGFSEIVFAGALSGRRFRYTRKNGYVLAADADFCIIGTIDPNQTKIEGPFGDHLGYYSLGHPFPFLKVKKVNHRPGAIWPITVVGRPPQEDTVFGKLVHEITGPMVPKVLPGLKAVHAVDAAGVHPLLLAIGKERYLPYQARQPMEILTQANAVLGFGHCSLAKYLLICADGDDPHLDIEDIGAFFLHMLKRLDWRKDLHFHTKVTIDTLDYSGQGINSGSKLVMAAAGEPIRKLSRKVPSLFSLPTGFEGNLMAIPGVLVIGAPGYENEIQGNRTIKVLKDGLKSIPNMSGWPLIVVADDPRFTAASLNNFLWVTFTRSNPSHDIHGCGSFVRHKHWGCEGPLIIDARVKPHHAPPLIEDPRIERRVSELGAKGRALHGII